MSEFKYKVGDCVRVKSLDWYNANKDEDGNIDINDDFTFYADRSRYCGKVFTISEVFDNCYGVKEDNNEYYWTDEMIEGLVKEIKPKFKVGDKVILDPYPCKITDVQWKDGYGFVYTVRGTDFSMTVKENDLVFDERLTPTTDEIIRLIKNDWNNFKDRYDIPDDYHFVDKNGNEINLSEIVLEKKKPKYPKTFLECCDVLNIGNLIERGVKGYKAELFDTLQKLYICRDAYWKIAGEEMGLGEPWKPNWDKCSGIKYCIYPILNSIRHHAMTNEEYENRILAFPTAEMRDAFYEAFKEEIEKCKELL